MERRLVLLWGQQQQIIELSMRPLRMLLRQRRRFILLLLTCVFSICVHPSDCFGVVVQRRQQSLPTQRNIRTAILGQQDNFPAFDGDNTNNDKRDDDDNNDDDEQERLRQVQEDARALEETFRQLLANQDESSQLELDDGISSSSSSQSLPVSAADLERILLQSRNNNNNNNNNNQGGDSKTSAGLKMEPNELNSFYFNTRDGDGDGDDDEGILLDSETYTRSRELLGPDGSLRFASSNDDGDDDNKEDDGAMDDNRKQLASSFLQALAEGPSSSTTMRSNSRRNQEQEEKDATVHDLMEAMRQRQAIMNNKSYNATINDDNTNTLQSKSEELHQQVLASEQGFYNQSQIFRESLTDASKSMEASAFRHGQAFRKRQDAAISQLEDEIAKFEANVLFNSDNKQETIINPCHKCGCELSTEELEYAAMKKQQPGTAPQRHAICSTCLAEEIEERSRRQNASGGRSYDDYNDDASSSPSSSKGPIYQRQRKEDNESSSSSSSTFRRLFETQAEKKKRRISVSNASSARLTRPPPPDWSSPSVNGIDEEKEDDEDDYQSFPKNTNGETMSRTSDSSTNNKSNYKNPAESRLRRVPPPLRPINRGFGATRRSPSANTSRPSSNGYSQTPPSSRSSQTTLGHSAEGSNKVRQAPRGAANNNNYDPRRPTPKRPSRVQNQQDWVKLEDPDTGEFFYWNSKTDEMKWQDEMDWEAGG